MCWDAIVQTRDFLCPWHWFHMIFEIIWLWFLTHLIQINIVSLQSFQTPLHSLQDVFPAQSVGVGPPGVSCRGTVQGQVHLGGNHHVLAVTPPTIRHFLKYTKLAIMALMPTWYSHMSVVSVMICIL